MNSALALPQNLSVGSFDHYLIGVNQMPRLSAEEEHRLAVRFREEGDLDAARQLVLANLRFVVHIARGYRGYGLALPDLVQEGNIGLMKAVKRFDPDVGVRLVSFAVHWIRAEIHEFVIRNWRIVKIATTKAQRKLFFNLKKSKKRLGWLNPREAHAVASDLGVKVETVYEMENRLDNHDMAFDAPVNDSQDDQGNYCPSTYLATKAADPAAVLENADWDHYEQTRLHDAMARLDDRSRDILASRWLNEEKSTLHELADRYSVSAERIRQLEKNAMKKLKEAIV
ncbi:MAG: RNA polymerase sigma factor RpoH [Gammaproteobacteria bacterium]